MHSVAEIEEKIRRRYHQLKGVEGEWRLYSVEQ